MKKIYFFSITLLFLINTSVQGQTLHAIIFGDTKDATIGQSVYEDVQNMTTLMSIISTENNFKIKEHYYWGNDCNKTNVINVLQNLLCNQQDVVFFYYSGHGTRAIDDKSKFPQMCLGGNYDADFMPMYQADELIAKKNPKLRIVMADCCNNVVPGVSPKSDYGNGKAIVKSQPTTALKTLFGTTKGSVIVSSSKIGETSAGWAIGGAFTCCFLVELDKMIEGQSPIAWNTLLENTKLTTYRETSRDGRTGHTPIFDVNIEGQNSQTPAVEIGVPQSDNPFVSALIKMADNGGDELSRIRLVDPALNNYFSSSKAVVETYSQNGRTMLSRENARDFLERVSTSYKLINFSIMPASQTDANGKYTYLKIKEIYKQ